MKKGILLVLMVGLTILTGCSSALVEVTQTVSNIADNQAEIEPTITIPAAVTPQPTNLPQEREVVLGVYPSGFLQYKINEIISLDDWTSSIEKRTTLVATFMDFEYPDPESFIPAEMEAAWGNGYIPFVNLAVGYYHLYSAEQIANGEIDSQIRTWAEAYASWSKGGEKWALIAPLQEMNGFWTAYSGDPDNFKLAFRRIQEIFYEAGVESEAVSWVFAPNGWSTEGNEFELYYPGDGVVDVIGFSSFNFGDCSNWPRWEVYEDIYQPYLDRMYKMAPEKPIVIAEIGTVAEGGDKNYWLMDTYLKLISHPGLYGIIYFNREEFASSLEKCPHGTDYRVFNKQTEEGYSGYLEAIRSPRIVYYPPDNPLLRSTLFTRYR